MTSKEFVVWMQGFVEACNDYSPTPKQWDTIKDTLANVGEPISLPIGTPIGPDLGVPNTAPIQTLPFIQPYDPYNPYKITSGTTGESGVILTTSSDSNGTITYNPSTTTIWNPSGSNWSYTTTLQGVTGTNGPDDSKLNGIQTTVSNQLELEFEPKNK